MQYGINCALFRPGRLEREFQSHPERIGQLLSTIDRTLDALLLEIESLSTEKREGREGKGDRSTLRAYLFLLALKLRLLRFTDGVQCGVDSKDLLQKLRSSLRRVISRDSPLPFAHSKSVIRDAAALLLATFSKEAPEGREEFALFVDAQLQFGLKRSAAVKPGGWQQILHEAASTLLSHSPSIEQFFCNPDHRKELLTPALVRNLELPIEREAVWEGDFPLYSATDRRGWRLSFNIVEGTLLLNGEPPGSLRDAGVLKSSVYARISANPSFAKSVYLFGEDNEPREMQIEDVDGSLLYIYRGREEAIEKLLGGKRMAYLNESGEEVRNLLKVSGLHIHPLLERFEFWQEMESGRVRLLDRESAKSILAIEPEGVIIDEEGRRIEPFAIEGEEWAKPFLAFASQTPLVCRRVSPLKKKPYIELLFSNFFYPEKSALSFRAEEEAAEGRAALHLSLDPSWYVDEEESRSSGFAQGNSLLLRNGKGERRLLIAKRPVTTSLKRMHCLLLHLTEKGEVDPKSSTEYALSSYLFLMSGRYSEAMAHLQRVRRLASFSDEEFMILGWIFLSDKMEGAERSPDAVALRCYAASLAQHNAFFFYREGESDLSSDFSNPLKLLEATPEIWSLYWKSIYASERAVLLYEEYLRVRRGVTAPLRLEKSLRKGERRGHLLSPTQELQWLKMQLYPLTAPLNQRLSTLLSEGEAASVEYGGRDSFSPHSQISDIAAFARLCREYQREEVESARSRVREIYPRMRPGKAFRDAKNALITLAVEGSDDDRLWVEFLVKDSACEHKSHEENSELRALLSLLLAKPRDKVADFQRELSHCAERYLARRKNHSFCDRIVAEEFFRELKDSLKSTRSPSGEIAPAIALPKGRLPSLPEKQNGPPNGLPNGAPELTFTLPAGCRGPLERGDFLQETICRKAREEEAEIAPLPAVDLKSRFARERYRALCDDYLEGARLNREERGYTLREGVDLHALKATLESALEALAAKGEALYSELLLLARREPAGECERVEVRLQHLGGKKAAPAFGDCVACFLQGVEEGYRRMNSALSDGDISRLHALIGSYLTVESNRKHLQRMVDAAKLAIDKKGEEEAKELLAREIAVKRAYPPERHRAALVFEWAKGIALREEQLQDFLDLTAIDPKKKSFVGVAKQRMMGAGKTEILGPLVALAKADGFHLSTLIVPRALFAGNAQEVKLRSEKIFGQRAATFTFSRDAKFFSVNPLTAIYETIVDVIQSRGFLILTPETLSSLENKYGEVHLELKALLARKSEAYEMSRWDIKRRIEEIKEPLHILRKILLTMDSRKVDTYDEIDLSLDGKVEQNYTAGGGERLPLDERALTAKLFALSATESAIAKEGFSYRGGRTKMTESQYHAVKGRLVDSALTTLLCDPAWRKMLAVEELFAACSAGDVAALLKGEKSALPCGNELLALRHYLYEEKASRPPFISDLYFSCDAKKMRGAELLSLLKLQFTSWMKKTWDKDINSDYGFSHLELNRRIAKPYLCNNTPNEAAEFADPYEVINRTLALAVANGLDASQTARYIRSSVKRAHEEWEREGRPKELSALPAAKKFRDAVGVELPIGAHKRAVDVEFVKERLNSDSPSAIEQRIELFAKEELDKYELYKRHLFHNAHALASMAVSTSGYAGIIENAATLPVALRVDIDRGVKGKIIDVLIRNNDRVIAVGGAGVAKLLSDLFSGSSLERESCSALIDAGPRFKGIGSREVAAEILHYFEGEEASAMERRFRGVIYWDDQSDLMTFIGSGGENRPVTLPSADKETIRAVTGLGSEELFYYYPHSKITGAHADLPPTSRAIVTFDVNTPLRDFLQGVMRMRKLFDRQRVTVALSENALPLIAEVTGNRAIERCSLNRCDPSTLSIAELIPFAEHNESRRQEPALLRALQQMIVNAPRQLIKKKMLRVEGDIEEENRLFCEAEHLFTREQRIDLFALCHSTSKAIPAKEYGYRIAEEALRPLISNAFKGGFPPGYSFTSRAPNRSVNFRELFHSFLEGRERGEKPLLPEGWHELFEELQAILEKLLPLLPEEIELSEGGRHWSGEVVAETAEERTLEEQNERSRELESTREMVESCSREKAAAEAKRWDRAHMHSFPRVDLYPARSDAGPSIWPLRSVVAGEKRLERYAGSFEKNLLCTSNFVETLRGEVNLFSDEQKIIHELLILHTPPRGGGGRAEEGSFRVILCTVEEAAFFYEMLETKGALNSDIKLAIAEPNGFTVHKGNISWGDLGEEKEKLYKALLPTLFLSGDFVTLRREPWKSLFEVWMERNSSCKRLLFEKELRLL